jgi:hypothetical protein
MRTRLPAAETSSRPLSPARASRHLAHVRACLHELHAAVAGDPAAERAADRLHAHLASALHTLRAAPAIAPFIGPNSGGVDPGPKPSQRLPAAVAAELA